MLGHYTRGQNSKCLRCSRYSRRTLCSQDSRHNRLSEISKNQWLDPSWYTMAGLVVVGLTADRENAIADQVDELMSIAVGYHTQLSSVIKEVKSTGQFNRAGLAEIDGIAAFRLSAKGSEELWEKVYKLIEAHFEGSVDAQGEIQEAEKNIAQFSQGDSSAQEYISRYAILVRKLLRAGGQITEQRKIQLCLQGAKAEMQDGFMESVRLAKLNGSYNGQEYKVWTAFKSVMGRVGRSLPAARYADKQDDTVTQHVPSIHAVQVNKSAGAQEDDAVFKATVSRISLSDGRAAPGAKGCSHC